MILPPETLEAARRALTEHRDALLVVIADYDAGPDLSTFARDLTYVQAALDVVRNYPPGSER